MKDTTDLQCPGLGGGEGDSHMKGMGMLVRSLELQP